LPYWPPGCEMPEQRPPRQELIRRRCRSGFVGRRGEMSAFRDNLVLDSSFPGYKCWWRGKSGTRGRVLDGGVTGTAEP
jgi:hypothetical protein